MQRRRRRLQEKREDTEALGTVGWGSRVQGWRPIPADERVRRTSGADGYGWSTSQSSACVLESKVCSLRPEKREIIEIAARCIGESLTTAAARM